MLIEVLSRSVRLTRCYLRCIHLESFKVHFDCIGSQNLLDPRGCFPQQRIFGLGGHFVWQAHGDRSGCMLRCADFVAGSDVVFGSTLAAKPFGRAVRSES